MEENEVKAALIDAAALVVKAGIEAMSVNNEVSDQHGIYEASCEFLKSLYREQMERDEP